LHLDRNSKTLREPLDGAHEVEVLRLPDERDDIAALPAAEAVVELVDRVHRERRRLLLVERTAPRERRARGAPKLREPCDDLDHVCRCDDVAHGGVLYARHRCETTRRFHRTLLPVSEGEARRERKFVTVVFCDLVGFTARAESLDPEDVEA